MTDPTPLSPAAQAVRRDFAQIMQELYPRCRVSISATDALPITLETNDSSLQAGIDGLIAAALRAAADQVLTRLAGFGQESAWYLKEIAAELNGTNNTSENG